MVLTMPEPIDVPADGPDIYRAFAVPFPLDRDVTITGVEFRPGNRRVVHHSRIHLDADRRRPPPRSYRRRSPASARGSEALASNFRTRSRGLDARNDGPIRPRRRRPGHHAAVPTSSSRFTITRSASRVSDRSSVGLFFAKKPITRTMAGYSLCTDRIDIPAGEKRHKIILSTRLKADVHLYTVVPHAHYLCREFRLAATLPDGTIQPLVLDQRLGPRLARPVPLCQARPPAQGNRAHPRGLFRQFRGQSAQPQQAPPPRPLWRRDQRRDVRLPPGIPARRPQRLSRPTSSSRPSGSEVDPGITGVPVRTERGPEALSHRGVLVIRGGIAIP